MLPVWRAAVIRISGGRRPPSCESLGYHLRSDTGAVSYRSVLDTFSDQFWGDCRSVLDTFADQFWIDHRPLLDKIADHFCKCCGICRSFLEPVADQFWTDCRSVVDGLQIISGFYCRSVLGSFADQIWILLPTSYENLGVEIPANHNKIFGNRDFTPCLSVCLMLLCCSQGGWTWKSRRGTSRSSQRRRPR